MPEGDAIWRTARTLQRAVGGRVVTRFETVLPHLSRVDEDAPVKGRTVESVEAAGKWCILRFSGGLILLTHMLMSGSWHIYRPGERWQRPRGDMRVVIETAEWIAVAFQVPVAEFHSEESLARRDGLRALGPEVLKEDFDAARAVENLRSRPEMEIGAALLRQSLVSGLGNVFKSEVCFVCGVNPFRPVASLSDEELAALMSAAQKLMRANIQATSGGAITTRFGLRRRMDAKEGNWVYQRQNLPCHKCGTLVRTEKHAADGRTSYWCPRCQPLPTSR